MTIQPRVLVTGSDGFIGRNLLEHLRQSGIEEIETWHRGSSAALESLVEAAEIVVHLAGVNRPADGQDFTENVTLTARIVEAVNRSEVSKRVFLSSSIQSGNGSPYGNSKVAAEAELSRLNSIHSAFIARLPNVFGKWARPFYNSAVATFCHQAAHGQPLSIHDVDSQIDLVYIDDVCNLILEVVTGSLQPGLVDVDPHYRTSVGWIAETIEGFARDRASGTLPNLADPLVRSLFATFHSVLPLQGGRRRAPVNSDERGWLFELLKSQNSGQVFVSATKPGRVRGQHWHHSKVEKFCVVQGEGVLKFRPMGESGVGSIHLSGDVPEIVDIPPGTIHSIENTGENDLLLLVWASEIFDSNRPDTWFEGVE